MWKLIGAVLLVAAPMVPADAEDFRGFYLGVDVGQSALDVEKRDIDNSVVAAYESVGVTVLDGSSNLSKNDITYGLTVGYQVLRYLAVEAAYLDLGTASYTADATVVAGGVVTDGHVNIDLDGKGFALSGLGILPFGENWSAYARAGAFYSMVDTSVSQRVGGQTSTGSDSSNATNFMWGLGFGYTRSPWTTRVEYQTLTDVGDDDTIGTADVSRLTLSVTYRFGAGMQ
jgi:opacity protein-like surface antigen